MFAKQSMINRLSNPINRNRSAAKISKVMSSICHPLFPLLDRPARHEHPHVRRHQALHPPRQPRPQRGHLEEGDALSPPHILHSPDHSRCLRSQPRGPPVRAVLPQRS